LYRTLLVLCALPLDEVSCRVQGSNTLLMVACAAVYDPPFAIERHFGPRWHGFCLGLSACRFFGKVGKECALAFCDEAAGKHASYDVCGDALATSGRSRASGEFDPLGGDCHLLGVADGALASDIRRAAMASRFHVDAQSHVGAIDDVATLGSDQPSARREVSAQAVHGSTADDAAERCPWVRFRRASASSLRGGRDTEQVHSLSVPVSASSQSPQQAVSASTHRSQALADKRVTVSASSQSSQQAGQVSSQSSQALADKRVTVSTSSQSSQQADQVSSQSSPRNSRFCDITHLGFGSSPTQEYLLHCSLTALRETEQTHSQSVPVSSHTSRPCSEISCIQSVPASASSQSSQQAVSASTHRSQALAEISASQSARAARARSRQTV
jgi:hypothetical protein